MSERRIYSRQLSSGEVLSIQQLEDIATLIYETDPYIYPALFGKGKDGLKKATQLLTELIKKNNDEMFTLNNIYASFIDSEVVGIILWYKGNLKWNTNSLLEEAKQLNIALDKEAVEKVQKSYFSANYNNTSDSFISIINVCIKREFRGYGYGRSLMTQFIAEHNDELMELCVLCNNISAVELYERCGFRIESKALGFSINDSPPTVYYMRTGYEK